MYCFIIFWQISLDQESLKETMIQKMGIIKTDIYSREIDEKLHLLREDISQDISRITRTSTSVERLETQVYTILD